MKTHRFNLTVRTGLSRNDARLAILAAFAGRRPDGCEFYITAKRPELNWIKGTKSKLPKK